MSKRTHQLVHSKGGGPVNLARRLKIRPQSISRWIAKDAVPIDRVPAVEEATGVPRHLIRPDRPDLFPPPTRKRSCAMETAA